MKLLSVNLARSFWLCHLDEFNPKGKSLLPAILRMLAEIYKFRNMPSPQSSLDDKSGITFVDGEFTNSEGDTLMMNFTAYRYGLMADTKSSTQYSDAFLFDMLNRIIETFNLVKDDQIIRKKTYFSQLYISTDKSLELINPKLKQISQYLADNVLGQVSVPYEVGGISFWPDQTHSPIPPPFSIERAAAAPFSENRYISSSALQTDKHIELLNKLEDILGS